VAVSCCGRTIATLGRSRNALSPARPIGRLNSSKAGAVINRHKMAKHFALVIVEASFSFHRMAAAIAAEAALDRIYVVRTQLPRKALGDAAAVDACKSLVPIERAFRSLKTVDIHLRPMFPWIAPLVRARVLLCMLVYHVEHHMRARLAPCSLTRSIRMPPPQSLLADLATTRPPALDEKYDFNFHTGLALIQQLAFELLAINPDRNR
jgi:hypothetical protein